MQLIDPFQFRDLFSGVRSLALVGNAPSILQWKNGATIDSADLIVRFNRARTEGMEEAIGRRTDVLFVNASNSTRKSAPPDELSRPKCLVCFVSPTGTRTLDVAPFREWAGDIPILFTFGPDILGLPSPTRHRPLTSGTYALYTLLRVLTIERLFVTGFTMFGAVSGGAGKYWDEATPPAGLVHDLDYEGKLFVSMLQQFRGRLDTTPEVAELANRFGMEIKRERANTLQRLPKRIAEGLAWRTLGLAMTLRRMAESK